MKTKQILSLVMLILFTIPVVFAQENKPNPAEVEKAWKDYMTTGTMHKLLASANGEWDEEVSTWMDPAAPPVISKSSCINTMIMGGRYQQSVHKGDMDGMPFEGMSIWGWNNASNRFESTWIDNMGTGIMFTEGRWDDKTKTATFRGRTMDPVSKKLKVIREIFRFVDIDNQTLEMFEFNEGKETRTMAIKFTRKK